jgi:hypothetical protein
MFNIKVIIHEIHFNIISSEEKKNSKRKRKTPDLIVENIEETIYMECRAQLARV